MHSMSDTRAVVFHNNNYAIGTEKLPFTKITTRSPSAMLHDASHAIKLYSFGSSVSE